ncbi:cell wall-binding repeat-containing protein [Euzebya sp.]|uniref:cell wall-binding repeat-containing protein n=1 Tax=Euzebya sp. TaxID=1971409 RepID=UPI0035133EF1
MPNRATALLVVAVLIALGSAGAARAGGAVQRIAGDDPVGLSVAVSTATFDDAGADGTAALHAVLGRDDAFADSLAAGPLLAGGPLLYVPGGEGGTLPAAVADELVRVLPPGATVYLAGGTAAVAPAVEDAVADLELLPIRLGGEERTATAARIAEEAVALYGDPATVLLAAAGTWPDAIAGAALAAATSGADGAVPILLTDGGALSPAAGEFLDAAGEVEVLVLGGDAVIDDAVAESAGADGRLAGPTRAHTAAVIAPAFGDDPAAATVVQGWVDDPQVEGTDDGWIEGTVAATLLRPLLLTGPSADEVNEPTRAALSGRQAVTVVGAPDRVSDGGLEAIGAAR